MVIRHHLALQDYQNHDPASDKSATSSSPSQDVQPPASSGPPVNTKAAASSTSKTDTASGSTKTSSTTSSPPPQNGASATPSSKSTTSPSNLKDSKNNSPPPPSTPESTATKSSAAPASSSNSSTKSSSTPPPAPTPSPTPAASSKSLSSSPPATSNSTSSSSSSSSSSQSLVSGGRFLGIEISFLIDLGIVLAIIAIIIIIIVILYRRYQTRKDYNESPQIFAHKPNLGFNEEYHLNHSKIEKCLTPEKITIEEQNLLSGKLYQVEFKGTEKSAVYFHRRQSTTAYFEIEVLQANGSVEIGFIPCTSFQKLKNGEENMGSAGVGVNNSGFVQAEGENVYNYSWTLAFGDVFGIGLTKESSKFSQRRAWISKNGVLLNFPPNDEMDKWLATIEISVEQKNEYNIGTEKKEGEQEEEDQEDEQKMKEKAQRQKVEGLLKKQRISLKTFNKFQYYPVIVCHGNKDDSKPTVINVNVGGQIFRMYDTQFRSGLLRDKPLFGDD